MRAMHVLLKVNTTDPDLLKTHVDWATKHGAVWFGRDRGAPIADKRVARLERQLFVSVSTCVYLHPTGPNATSTVTYETTLDAVQRTSPAASDPQHAVAWYGTRADKELWLKLSTFRPIEAAWIDANLTYEDGRQLGGGLKNQTSPLYVFSKYEWADKRPNL